MSERQEQFRDFDHFFQRHKTFVWVLAIGTVFSIVGVLCVVRAIFQTLSQ